MLFPIVLENSNLKEYLSSQEDLDRAFVLVKLGMEPIIVWGQDVEEATTLAGKIRVVLEQAVKNPRKSLGLNTEDISKALGSTGVVTDGEHSWVNSIMHFRKNSNSSPILAASPAANKERRPSSDVPGDKKPGELSTTFSAFSMSSKKKQAHKKGMEVANEARAIMEEKRESIEEKVKILARLRRLSHLRPLHSNAKGHRFVHTLDTLLGTLHETDENNANENLLQHLHDHIELESLAMDCLVDLLIALAVHPGGGKVNPSELLEIRSIELEMERFRECKKTCQTPLEDEKFELGTSGGLPTTTPRKMTMTGGELANSHKRATQELATTQPMMTTRELGPSRSRTTSRDLGSTQKKTTGELGTPTPTPQKGAREREARKQQPTPDVGSAKHAERRIIAEKAAARQSLSPASRIRMRQQAEEQKRKDRVATLRGEMGGGTKPGPPPVHTKPEFKNTSQAERIKTLRQGAQTPPGHARVGSNSSVAARERSPVSSNKHEGSVTSTRPSSTKHDVVPKHGKTRRSGEQHGVTQTAPNNAPVPKVPNSRGSEKKVKAAPENPQGNVVAETHTESKGSSSTKFEPQATVGMSDSKVIF